MRVIGFGDNIVDKFIDRGTDYPGGNSVNFAVFAAQLGVESAYLGVLGTDAMASHLKEALNASGVDHDRCGVVDGETGWCSVEVRGGDRVFVDWNEGGVSTANPLKLDDELLRYLSEFDLVHSGVYGRTETEMPKVAALPGLTSFDFSAEKDFRTDDYLVPLAPNLDLATFSCSEDSEGDIRALLERTVGLGAGYALATRGPSGSVFFDGQKFYTQDAFPVQDAVDTMGCGDAFIAAFATALLAGGWTRQAAPTPELIGRTLSDAARFAARQCLTEGAFGHGKASA